MYGYSLVQIVL
ncbi:Protein of unknown function [Bacillus wiedmannii]|nr:Protein of unknown function [Bacillus wiedmannii]